MRLKLLILAVLCTVVGWGQSIFMNPITGSNPNSVNPYITGQTVAPNITVEGIRRSTGINGENANDRYNAKTWNVTSLTTNRYFEFKLTPSAGYQINFIALNYTSQASGTGPTQFAVRSSIDGYDSNLGSASVTGATIDLSGPGFQNVTSTIIFRVYAWGASAAGGTFSINDFDFTGTVTTVCVPPVVSNPIPNSGPAGTEVTFTATSGSLLGATASISGLPATIISNDGIVMVIEIPEGADTGDLMILDGNACLVKKPFIVKNTEGTCGAIQDLIISEIYDHSSGAQGYIEIYNGTSSTINLSGYYIRRYGDSTSLANNTGTNYSFPSGLTIAPGVALAGRLTTDANVAGVVPDFDYVSGNGINGDDIFHLYNGTTIIDVFEVPIATAGYDFRRNITTLGNNYTSNPSDWASFSGVSNLKIFAFVGSYSPPTISEDPIDIVDCGAQLQFSVTATPFISGTLTYQWYMNTGTNNTWTLLTPSGMAGVTITGADDSLIQFSGIGVSVLYGRQFYCLVTQDGCAIASKAAQIKLKATTWGPSNTWSNGLPNINTVAIINNNYDTATYGSFSCCNLDVRSARNLIISDNTYVEIQNNIINAGNIQIRNNGQLIQIDEEDGNTGNYTGSRFEVERIAKNIKKYDYVYWSAPTEGFNLSGITGSMKYYWDTTAVNANGSQGNWINASGIMNKGQGYIVRAPNSLTSPTDVPIYFRGKPFNGAFTYPSTRGTNSGSTNDNLVLLGNPYPSALDADVFLDVNDALIEGAVRLWMHGLSPSEDVDSPFYQNFTYNYSENDYLVYNGTASTIPGFFEGKIASGQGFFVTLLETGGATKNIQFSNAMRGNSISGILNNSHFFRTTSGQTEEKHRIWLDILDASNALGRTAVVGYVPNATMDKDNRYDAYATLDVHLNLYSLIDSEKMQIQGRALPFVETDQVPLGIYSPSNGMYTIALRHADGVFDQEQGVYLEDKALEVVHDLKQAPYRFYSQEGQDNSRFVLRYTTQALGIEQPVSLDKAVVAFSNQGQLTVNSNLENIKQVIVYDVLGRTLLTKTGVGNKVWSTNALTAQNATLLLHITLENGFTVVRKVMLQ